MIFQIDDPIYGHGPIVAIAESTERVVAAVRRAGYEVDDETRALLQMDGLGRTVVDLETGMRVVRLASLDPRRAHDVAILAHEAVHLAVTLFERIKTPVDSGHDEPLAYYVQFIVRAVLERARGRSR